MRALIPLVLLLTFATSNAENHVDTLKRVAETGEFRIGYVPDAPPLSFHDRENNVVGYSIDLCRRSSRPCMSFRRLESNRRR